MGDKSTYKYMVASKHEADFFLKNNMYTIQIMNKLTGNLLVGTIEQDCWNGRNKI